MNMKKTPKASTLRKHVYAYEFTRRRVGENLGTASTPSDLAAIVRPLFEGLETEHVVVVLLDRKQHVVGLERLYVGNVAGCSVRIAEVFRAAVRLNAAGIALAHNHPSGDAEPSSDDLRTTRDIHAAGRLLGIALVDHLVMGEDRWVSLRERGGMS